MTDKNFIQQVSGRLEKIMEPYRGRDDFGNLRPGFWGEELTSKILWMFYYEDINHSTRAINFNYYTQDKLYAVSGKMISMSEREPEIKTADDEEAYSLVEERIKEIPIERETVF